MPSRHTTLPRTVLTGSGGIVSHHHQGHPIVILSPGEESHPPRRECGQHVLFPLGDDSGQHRETSHASRHDDSIGKLDQYACNDIRQHDIVFILKGLTLTDRTMSNVDQFLDLSLIHISEPTRRTPISYAVFC